MKKNYTVEIVKTERQTYKFIAANTAEAMSKIESIKQGTYLLPPTHTHNENVQIGKIEEKIA